MREASLALAVRLGQATEADALDASIHPVCCTERSEVTPPSSASDVCHQLRRASSSVTMYTTISGVCAFDRYMVLPGSRGLQQHGRFTEGRSEPSLG